jgi:hypothetical protein
MGEEELARHREWFSWEEVPEVVSLRRRKLGFWKGCLRTLKVIPRCAYS